MLSRDWLLGFIEAQASFSIIFKKSKTALKYQVSPDFTLKAPPAERPLLEEIHRTLGVGHLYEGRGEAILKATKLGDAEKLIAFLSETPFMSARRAQEFAHWAACVRLLAAGEHRTKLGLLKLALRRELLRGRVQGNGFCHVRRDVDPCAVYQEQGGLPENCRACFDDGQLVPLSAIHPARLKSMEVAS